jgi:peptide/nickel transport system permease protein
MGLKEYIIKRLLQLIPTILIVIVFNFVLIHLAPGDPALIIAGDSATGGYLEALREKYGLNKPLQDQLFIYLSKILRGDLGYSITYNAPVSEIILERIPRTLMLVFASELFSIVIGIIIGAYSARNYLSKRDIIISLIAIIIYSMPVFWVGLLLLIYFGVNLRLLPIGGMWTILGTRGGVEHILDVARHLILPGLTLASLFIPQYIRLTRASIAEVMREDYITTARAVALNPRKIFMKHALRNAILPLVTSIGMWLGSIFGGAILTERVFSWPGMGRLMVQSIFLRDYPVIMGIFIITSITITIAMLLTDISYAYLDPRIVYS